MGFAAKSKAGKGAGSSSWGSAWTGDGSWDGYGAKAQKGNRGWNSTGKGKGAWSDEGAWESSWNADEGPLEKTWRIKSQYQASKVLLRYAAGAGGSVFVKDRTPYVSVFGHTAFFC